VIDSGFESSKKKKERKKVRGMGFQQQRKKERGKEGDYNLLGPKAKR